MTPEGRVTKKIQARLKRRGALARKIHGHGGQKRGISDFLSCYMGYFIAIEVKAPGKEDTVTELQKKFLADVEKAGGFALVASSVKQVRDLLDYIDSLEDA
jgi:hypothetical protein